MIELVLEYSWWMLLPCLLCGALYTALLYYKNKDKDFSGTWKYILMSFRFISVSLLAFLLLSPLVKTVSKTKEKPLLIFAQDNSESIKATNDSSFYKTTYSTQIQNLLDEFDQEYSLEQLEFSNIVEDDCKFDFSGNKTDFSALFNAIESRYANRNIGALIIASDGLYNQGVNPVYTANRLKYPIYTLALGDTQQYADIQIKKLYANKVAYLGNRFPVQADIFAQNIKGKSFEVRLYQEGSLKEKKRIQANSDSYFEKLEFFLQADKEGYIRCRIETDILEEEIVDGNNSKTFFVDVLDGKQKILLLCNGVHPDIGALKTAIENNENYAVDVVKIKDFKSQQLKAYHLVIAYNLPDGSKYVSQHLNFMKQNGMPIWYILGNQTHLASFNKLGSGLQIRKAKNNSHNEAYAKTSDDLSWINLSDHLQKQLNQFPPLMVPFGEFVSMSNHQAIAHQRIGNVSTSYPLFALYNDGARKSAVLCGEGIWRWPLKDFYLNENQEAFDELIQKVCRYLTISERKDRFRILSPGELNQFDEVVFGAEFYNEAFELIEDAEIKYQLTDEEGNSYPHQFIFKNKQYQLNLGRLPIGSYQWKASTRYKNENHEAIGRFVVEEQKSEYLNLQANHTLLRQLASQSGGEFIALNDIEKLKTLEKVQFLSKPIVYEHKRYRDLVDIPLLFIVVVFLLSLEWFIRKWSGSY